MNGGRFMRYSIGLDVGIKSVGWAIMELDNNDEPKRIVKLGSRIFQAAEQPKTGASLALPRREARLARRIIRRRTHRKQRIKYLFVSSKLISEESLDSLFAGQLEDIYYLRTKALDELLSSEELARVLIHISQRRGFKSNRKADSQDKENGKLLNCISENEESLLKNGYRTVGEMLYKDKRFADCKRNKSGNYINTVSRSMILNEINSIFDAQIKLGSSFLTDEFCQKYVDIVMSQRSYANGPGEGSKYSGNQIEKMVGNCSLIEGESRAAKASYSFQYFSLLQAVNNVMIVSPSKSEKLTPEQRKMIIEAAHKSPSMTYEKIRKILDLPNECRFNISYGYKSAEEVEKKTKFDYLQAYHKIRQSLDKVKKGYINSFKTEEINAMGYALTVFESDEDIRTYLENNGIEKTAITQLLSMSKLSKFGHISVKACDMLIPCLEKGMGYSEACESLGLVPMNENSIEDITNPVVKRAVSQTMKVVNAIIRDCQDEPIFINIELAREMSKNHDERMKIENAQKENTERNNKIKERLEKEFGVISPTGLDIVKFRLWEEQGGVCPYSQSNIEVERLFENGYAQVDHIIPYSISFDDSYSNKVLVKSAENQRKGNRLPLQYMGERQASDFRVWVESQYKNFSKKQKLLKEKITENDRNSFKERNLNDTRYICRFLLNYLKSKVNFKDYNSGKSIHVHAVNGVVTAYIRKRWGITKIRSDGDLHHAVDAAVIACITPTLIQRVSRYSDYQEKRYCEVEQLVVDKRTGEVVDKFPLPYPTFVKELDARTSNNAQYNIEHMHLPNYSVEDVMCVKAPFVSRMPKHKVKGAAHKETIKAQREKGKSIKKVDLSKLEVKNGEIENYYNKSSDLLLYNALLERLAMFGNDAKKAFPIDYDFHKPKADGTQGPIVKKVKIEETQTLAVSVRDGNGVADNGSMIRVDVFKIQNDGYYLVPIYVHNALEKELPNKAIVAHKPYEEWKEMNEKDFVFSIYPNDLIRVRTSKKMCFSLGKKDSTLPTKMYSDDIMLYYIKTGISSATISVETHDGSYTIPSLGVKTLLSIEKYSVDVLGNYHLVKNEPRLGFDIKK